MAERIRHQKSSPGFGIAFITLAGAIFIGMPLGLAATQPLALVGWVLCAVVFVVGLSKIAHAVAERRRVEDALLLSQARLNAALAAGHMGTWVLDVRRDRIWWDDACATLFGRVTEEVQHCTLATFMGFLHPDHRASVQAAVAVSIDNGTDYQVEYRTLRPDGATQWISARGGVERNTHGRLSQVTGACVDITERKAVEERIEQFTAELEQRVKERTAELEETNKELEAFSYSVSHDLRAPLRAVNGYSGIVLQDYGPQLPAEGRRYLEKIRNSARAMGDLIDDLLMFSRLNRQPLTRCPVDTSQLVGSVLEELGVEQEGRVVDVRVGDLPACEGDRALLKQAWFNLLSNALKYTRKRASTLVEIGCLPREGETVYFVRDNGSGFDMRYASKLFGVFQRLHRAEDFEGTGIGLAIVHSIVQRHGGRVWAEAEVDRGATFFFTLAGGANA